MSDETLGSSVGDNGRAANPPSKPVTGFGKLACPFLEEFPNAVDDEATCYNGSKDFKHLKEHLKNHHKCKEICPSPCPSPLHMTDGQLLEVKIHKHLSGELEREQWLRLYRAIFGKRGTPAPYVPTIAHVTGLSNAPPPGFVEELAQALCADIPRARRFLHDMGFFLDVVRHGGVFSGVRDREVGEHVPEPPAGAGNGELLCDLTSDLEACEDDDDYEGDSGPGEASKDGEEFVQQHFYDTWRGF